MNSTGLLENNFITLLKVLRFNRCLVVPLGHWGVKGAGFKGKKEKSGSGVTKANYEEGVSLQTGHWTDAKGSRHIRERLL